MVRSIVPISWNCHLTSFWVTTEPSVGATGAPIEELPSEIGELVLDLFLEVAQFSVFVERTMYISPADRGRAFVRPVTKFFLFTH